MLPYESVVTQFNKIEAYNRVENLRVANEIQYCGVETVRYGEDMLMQ